MSLVSNMLLLESYSLSDRQERGWVEFNHIFCEKPFFLSVLILQITPQWSFFYLTVRYFLATVGTF
jgi:hypothetical protein